MIRNRSYGWTNKSEEILQIIQENPASQVSDIESKSDYSVKTVQKVKDYLLAKGEIKTIGMEDGVAHKIVPTPNKEFEPSDNTNKQIIKEVREKVNELKEEGDEEADYRIIIQQV